MAATFAESIQLEEAQPGHFKSRWNPEGNGSAILGDEIAFGGTTLAMGVQAAHRTVKPGYYMFSAVGNFLSPAFTTAPLEIKVNILRDTRTFATRQIVISQQKEQDASLRVVLHMTVDFHAKAEDSMYEYGPTPGVEYSGFENSYSIENIKEHAARKLGGKVPDIMAQIYDSSYQSTRKYWTTRIAPESLSAQTFAGFLPHLPTSQDQLNILDRYQVNWFKPVHALTTDADHFSALAYVLDSGSAVMPPVLGKTDLSQIAAATTLDFALRFFKADLNMNELHLRVDKTIRASEGRTYQEARVWDMEGTMVANSTQQCILRQKSSKIAQKL